MSGGLRAARLGFAAICAVSVGAVVFVHRDQKQEAKRLHDGVQKDAVRMKWRKAEIEKEKAAGIHNDYSSSHNDYYSSLTLTRSS